ncbi:hypothetical protein Moror_13424 [Moniliophthora roreri MCA 2997]|uniref:JmjC domain-containing protein n=1 Tax=Moniliophthora roreri (strain MCA 2997) TaxID=1381753 RepID=V2WKC6_MONRO|nr:hypothetical protein Moror_13424 [Moniliophthora roreri MCA 2997]
MAHGSLVLQSTPQPPAQTFTNSDILVEEWTCLEVMPFETSFLPKSLHIEKSVEEVDVSIPEFLRPCAIGTFAKMRLAHAEKPGLHGQLRSADVKILIPAMTVFIMPLRVLDISVAVFSSGERNPRRIQRTSFSEGVLGMHAFGRFTCEEGWLGLIEAVQNNFKQYSRQPSLPTNQVEDAGSSPYLGPCILQLRRMNCRLKRSELDKNLHNMEAAAFALTFFLMGHHDLPSQRDATAIFGESVANIRSVETKVPKRVRQPLFMAVTISPLILLVNISLLGNDIKRDRMVEAWFALGNDKPKMLVKIENWLWEGLFDMGRKGTFAEHALEKFLKRVDSIDLGVLNLRTKTFFQKALSPECRVDSNSAPLPEERTPTHNESANGPHSHDGLERALSTECLVDSGSAQQLVNTAITTDEVVNVHVPQNNPDAVASPIRSECADHLGRRHLGSANPCDCGYDANSLHTLSSHFPSHRHNSASSITAGSSPLSNVADSDNDMPQTPNFDVPAESLTRHPLHHEEQNQARRSPDVEAARHADTLLRPAIFNNAPILRMTRRTYLIYALDGRSVKYAPSFFPESVRDLHEELHRLLGLANEAAVGNGGAPIALPPDQAVRRSVRGINCMPYEDFARMDRSVVRKLFRVNHLLVTHVPLNGLVGGSFDRMCLQNFASEMGFHKKREMYDFSRLSLDHAAEVVAASFEDLITEAHNTGRLLACVNVSGGDPGFPMADVLNALRSDHDAWLDMQPHSQHSFASVTTNPYACLDMVWRVASVKDVVERGRFSPSGFATSIGVEVGAKLVLLFVPRDSDDYARTDLASVAGLDSHQHMDAQTVAVVLLPGDILLIRPGTFHYVVSLQHSISRDSFFLSCVTIRQTCWALFHEMFRDQRREAPRRKREDRLWLVQLMVHWHYAIMHNSASYIELCADGNPSAAHIPNLLTFTGLIDFLTMFNVLELGDVLWHELYSEDDAAFSSDDHSYLLKAYQTGCTLGREILDWFREHFIIESIAWPYPPWQSLYHDLIDPAGRIEHIFRSYMLQQCSALLAEAGLHMGFGLHASTIRQRILSNFQRPNSHPWLTVHQVINHLDAASNSAPTGVRTWTNVDGYNWEPDQRDTYAWIFEYRALHYVQRSQSVGYVHDRVQLERLCDKVLRENEGAYRFGSKRGPDDRESECNAEAKRRKW